jgi:hypothetical protein
VADHFNYGDKVEVNGHVGRIRSIWFDKAGNKTCTVEFDDKNLIPPSMDFPESRLKQAQTNNNGFYGGWYDDMYRRQYGPIEKVCPRCGTDWTVTKFNNHVWYDCKKCQKKKEDLI